jgi:arylsulfatase A-like enzyme
VADGTGLPGAAGAGGRPNLVLVFADQMRGMDMGCAGNPQVQTPCLDRLAAEGARLCRAYANAPVCTPSRAVLLTGRHAIATTVVANDLPLPEGLPTLGSCMRGAGYRTAYIGKWHLDGVPRSRWTPPGPRRHGFERWAAYNCSHDYLHARYYGDGPEPIALPGYEPVAQTDLLLSFIDEPDPRPFAAVLSWGPPHDPYEAVPEHHRARYDPAALRLRPNVRPIAPGPGDLAGGRDVRRTLACYYAHITALDEQVGRIRDHLERRGRSRDTLLVFTSDHGDMLWSQGRMMKQQPWEESVQVPLLLRWPGRVPAGRTVADLTGLVDLLPTLLGLLGVPVPAGVQGADLSAAVLAKPAAPRARDAGPASVFLYDLVSVDQSHRQGIPEWRGVRTARHTYARTRAGPWLLYDNERDPYQLDNLVGRPELAAVQAGCEAELEGWLRRTGDPFEEGPALVRRLGLAPAWNARERELHPGAPRLLPED